MALKKETLTQDRIKSDIKDVIKYGKNMTGSEYSRFRYLSVLLNILVIVVLLVYVKSVLWIIADLFLFIVIYPTALIVWTSRKTRAVKADDYDVTEGTVYGVSDETYTERRGKYNYVDVTNYFIHFEGGKTWHIPENVYCRSDELNMSPAYLYEHTHRGDRFILVVHKKSGEIVMAYDTEFFEYKIS